MSACPACGLDAALVLEHGRRILALEALVEGVERDREACELYRRALVRIAGAESGVWGTIAAGALREAEAR